MALPFPAIDPVILPLWGPLALRWYNLAYMVGLTLGWLYASSLLKYLPARGASSEITRKVLDNFLVWVILGILVGGRLGYTLFYEAGWLGAEPWRIFRVWEGGMSFHGALLGCGLSLVMFGYRYKVPLLSLADISTASAPLGLGLGRLANFVNDELWGRPTQVPWAVMFPSGGYVPRHPSQLYEAFLEGILLFLILRWFIIKRQALKRPGEITAVFVMLYGIFRFGVEYVRFPDGMLSMAGLTLSTGQWLSLPMMAAGALLFYGVAMRARPLEGRSGS